MIHCWTLPSSNIDPYDSYDPSVLSDTLFGHGDAVWGLSMYQPRSHLLSASADGTVKLWSPQNKIPLLNTFASEQGLNSFLLNKFFMFFIDTSIIFQNIND